MWLCTVAVLVQDSVPGTPVLLFSDVDSLAHFGLLGLLFLRLSSWIFEGFSGFRRVGKGHSDLIRPLSHSLAMVAYSDDRSSVDIDELRLCPRLCMYWFKEISSDGHPRLSCCSFCSLHPLLA